MKQYINDLLKDPIFNKEVKWKVEEFEPRKKIICEGENDQNVYIVIDGVVHVTTFLVLNENERREMGIAKLYENEIFGEIAMFDNQPRSANVVADTACKIAVIDCLSFNEYLERHPERGYQVMRYIVDLLVKRMRHNNIRSNSILAWYMLENTEPLASVE